MLIKGMILMKLSLSQGAYSAKQVLANEANVALSQHITMKALMERAGQAAFSHIQQCYLTPTYTENQSASLLILCGKGNNGGDGFVVAKLAYAAGYHVEVFIACAQAQLKGDALSAYTAMMKEGVEQVTFNLLANAEHLINAFKGEIIVDALFGIGLESRYSLINNADAEIQQPIKAGLSMQWQTLFAAVNQHKATVVSIDVPSGLCATTGVPQPTAIAADSTITFIAYKQGLLTGQAANYVGQLVLAGLSVNQAFNDQVATDTVLLLPSDKEVTHGSYLSLLNKRLAASHKGNIGLALGIGGGIGLPGAIRLASEAALRCGAALLAVCCHQQNQALVFNGRPELMLAPTTAKELSATSLLTQAKVLFIGPGLGRDTWSQQLFSAVSQYMCVESLDERSVKGESNQRFVLDADALHWLSQRSLYCDQWVLTPHPKEAAALLHCNVATIEGNRFDAVRAIAKKYGGICLLKGAGSLISDGNKVVINSTGNAGMASGGMGDVLTGIIAALLLQMTDKFAAVCLAGYIHGAAADIIANNHGQRGMLASDLFIELQHLVNQH